MTTITLSIAPSGLLGRVWVAEFSGPEAVEIRRCCGTTSIPTAYRASMSGDRVRMEIQRLNPLADVVVVEREG